MPTQRSLILQAIQDYINDNSNKEITALDVRTVLNLLADSMFNQVDEPREALVTSNVDYDLVGNSNNWNGNIAPITQNLVNDELASRVKTIENSPAVQYAIELYANTDSTVSNIFPLYGKVLLFGNVNKSSKVTNVTYETSVNGGDSWVTPPVLGGTLFADLDAHLTSITTQTSFVLLRATFTFLSGYVGEQSITLNYTQA